MNDFINAFICQQTELLLKAGLEYEKIVMKPDPIYGAYEIQFVKIPANSYYYDQEDALFRTPEEMATYLKQLKILEFFYSGLMSSYIRNREKYSDKDNAFMDYDIQYAMSVAGENPPISIKFTVVDTYIKDKDLNGYMRRYQLFKNFTIQKLQDLSAIIDKS